MEWTEVRVAALRQLWADGHSAREIADELGTSRNGILGKAFRLHLPGHKPGVRPQPPPPPPVKVQKAATVKPPQIPTANGHPPRMRRLALLELENHHCRWPFNDPRHGSFYFCAADKPHGQVYCPTHQHAAFRRGKED
jgi:GcrA cell cycle regulator